MNKNAIKSFAIDARKWLRDKIEAKLSELGITEDGVSGVHQQTETEVRVTDLSTPINAIQYKALKKYVTGLKKSYGDNWYNELVEESAYIWFNRIVGIKYMEVNGYLPENINILTSTTGRVEPDIIMNYEYLGYADTLDKNFIRNGILNHDTEGVFRYLFLMENHQLSKIMPFMFAKENDFSDLVFPEKILGDSGIIAKINTSIAEEDWKEIEIIGWLYQFYNSEKKDEVFLGLKNNKKLTKDTIPAATQLFTPKWIVKYMVENSLGKLALEEIGVRESIKENWKYFIEAESKGVINNARTEGMKIEDVKILDPSMGSGHILVYAFDVLYQIYEELGYSRREAVASIINNNLYGMDIDDRAATLASFALVMKGREYFSRIFSALDNEEIEINTLSIQESNSLEDGIIDSLKSHNLLELIKLIELFDDAKEYGSILKVGDIDLEKAEKEFGIFESKEALFYSEEKKLLKTLIKQAKIMSQKYDVTVTNPPYMGTKGYSEKLKKYVESNFKDSKADMFAVFIEKCMQMTKENRYTAMIVMQSWMFLSSFEELRLKLIQESTISSLIHLGYGAIGIAFGTTSFCLKNVKNVVDNGHYFRMFNKMAQVFNPEDVDVLFRKVVKNKEFRFNFSSYIGSEGIREEVEGNTQGQQLYYSTSQQDFHKIPGSPIAYWVSDRVKEIFEKSEKLGDVGDAKQGLATGENDRFLRYWKEVSFNKIGLGVENRENSILTYKKWFPCNKGGEVRRWYGNNEYIVNWENDGEEIRNFKDINGKLRSRPQNLDYYFKKGFTWSTLSSSKSSFRYSPVGHLFETKGSVYFIKNEEDFFYLGGFLNTDIVTHLLKITSPTLDFHEGPVSKIPIILTDSEFLKDLISNFTQKNIDIAKSEWDSRETSWDFKANQLVISNEELVMEKILDAFDLYTKEWKEKFYEMHRNEEELNRLFIEIYGLQEEMTPDVDLKDITLLKKELLRRKSAKKATDEEEAEEAGLILDDKGEIKFNKEEIIKQFISYAIGCNMGRYSIDKEGLVIANSDDKLIINSEELRVVGASLVDDQEDIRHIIPNPRYSPDNDGIIPVTDTNYFAGEDVVERFEEFLVAVYGKENLEENFKFIAEAIKDSKNEPREVLREYFMGDFYADHLQRYSKRPIYWLVSSNGKGKGAAFNAYIYLHRYNKNTIPAIRGKYVNELQAKLKSKEDLIEKRLLDDSLSIKEKKELKDEKDRYRKQLNELLEFDKKLNSLSNQMIDLDLDDGVKVNYGKLAEILYKVKM